jgi:hypothetical protein
MRAWLNGRRWQRAEAEVDTARMADLIIEIESQGNAELLTPSTGALGLGQFVEATWLKLIQRHRPDLADRPRQEVLALRADPALAKAMVERLVADNVAHLKAAGLAATPTTLYLTHFLGLPAARRVLAADRATPVAELVEARAIRDNRAVLEGKTAREVVAWAERCIGVAALKARARQRPTPARV